MKKTLKAAVVGCGRIGFEFDNDKKRKHIATHIGAYHKLKDIDLVAVCDLDQKKIKSVCKKINYLKGYTDINEMLTKERVDILSICTLAQTHYQLIKKAVKFRPKAIFCEKPLASTVGDAKKILSLCRKNNIILQVGHQRRFDRLHLEIRGLIKNKLYGGVQQANFYYTAGINNTGSHMFDLLCFFFGEPVWISALKSNAQSYRKDDPNLDGLLQFKKGPLVTFGACDVKKYLVFELNCFLDKARFLLKNSGSSIDFYKTVPSPSFSGYSELVKTNSPYKTIYKRDFMVNALNHLVDCIENKKESISSASDGLLSVKIINSALRSAKNNGRQIKID